jgi:N-acylneuraminate cytidylyltransferase
MKNVALIPARGGSKTIPKKNIKLFNGRPLISYVIQAALYSEYITAVYVSTDSKDIARIATNYGAISIDRSQASATDTASTEMCMLEFANRYEFDNIVLLQATSPLTTSKNIDEAATVYENYDSILSVIEFNKFVWDDNGPVNYDPLARPRRQEMTPTYVENGAIYITSKQNLLNSKCRISGNIGLYKMDKESYFDLDDNNDWTILEKVGALDAQPVYDPERAKQYIIE